MAALAIAGATPLWSSPGPTRATSTSLNFSLAIDGVCDTNGGEVKCDIPVNSDVDISVMIEDISGIGNFAYDWLGVWIDYSGAVSSNGRLSMPWPDCFMPTTGHGAGYESIECGAMSPVTYTGLVVTGSFHCAEGQGTLALNHGPFQTFVSDSKGVMHYEKGTDVITVNCEPVMPTPTKQPPPGDSDGDGCPDADENGPDEFAGGRRDYLNPWDYFNPTNDGENRVDDIVAVLHHYYLDQGQPGYDEKHDRTRIGPNDWNLGPPNGQIRVDDIIHAVKSYFHDCGTGAEKPAVTPTPTVTPTPVPLPNPLDFSIGVDADGDTSDDCDTIGGPAKCAVGADETFRIKAYLNGVPIGVYDYEGINLSLIYEGVRSKDNASNDPWPDCVYAASYYEPGIVQWGCVIGVAAPASTHVGLVGTTDFNCEASGTITMVHGIQSGDTELLEEMGSEHAEGEGTTEALTINCD